MATVLGMLRGRAFSRLGSGATCKLSSGAGWHAQRGIAQLGRRALSSQPDAPSTGPSSPLTWPLSRLAQELPESMRQAYGRQNMRVCAHAHAADCTHAISTPFSELIFVP